jgi:hypothetical protein
MNLSALRHLTVHGFRFTGRNGTLVRIVTSRTFREYDNLSCNSATYRIVVSGKLSHVNRRQKSWGSLFETPDLRSLTYERLLR